MREQSFMERKKGYVLPEPVGIIPFDRRHQMLPAANIGPQQIDCPRYRRGAAPVHAEDADGFPIHHSIELQTTSNESESISLLNAVMPA